MSETKKKDADETPTTQPSSTKEARQTGGEDALVERSDWALMKRLWGVMRPYRGMFAASLVLLPVLSGLELVQPYLIQVAIDDHFVPGEAKGLAWVIGAFIAAIVGRAFVQFLQLYLMQQAGQQALHDLRQELFDHVQSLHISFFHRTPVGRLMTRMTTDVDSLQEALSSGMVTMVGDLFTLAAIVVILLYKDWQLALVSFSVVPVLLGLTALFRHMLRQAFRDIRTRVARLNAHLQESVTGMPVIQLFAREEVSAQEYDAINAHYREANIRSIRYDAMLYALVEAIGSITVGAIIWYGSGGVVKGAVTLGVLVAFIEYMQKFFVPIRDLAQKYNLFQSAMASSERIFQLLDTDEHIEQAAHPAPMPDPAVEPLTIELRDVWFAYDAARAEAGGDRDPAWILRGVSMTIRPGEKVALVGHTGAGKSTVLGLLLRLHDPTRGQVLVNGVELRALDVKEWRAQLSVVLQDAFLFNGTVRENLIRGMGFADEDEAQAAMIQAARTVRAHDLVSRYEEGYDHRVGERGRNLSAGERQLVSFARALVHHPEVLLLDEATANVDTETEALIQEALDALLSQQTSLIIAHRLSTIRKATRILVLRRGQIIERGDHETLLAQGGHYADLHRLQFAS